MSNVKVMIKGQDHTVLPSGQLSYFFKVGQNGQRSRSSNWRIGGVNYKLGQTANDAPSGCDVN